MFFYSVLSSYISLSISLLGGGEVLIKYWSLNILYLVMSMSTAHKSFKHEEFMYLFHGVYIPYSIIVRAYDDIYQYIKRINNEVRTNKISNDHKFN